MTCARRLGVAVVAVAAAAVSAPAAHAATQTFSFTGEEQTFTVPDGVTSLRVEAIGARGAFGGLGGGLGAYVSADIPVSASGPVTPGQVLFVEVGGNANGAAGGFNGGGAGIVDDVSPGGGGGGASDVRTCTLTPLVLGTCDSTAFGSAQDPRLIVAGGGGGHSDSNGSGSGGNGGTPNGDDGQAGESGGGGGGTDTAGGTGGAGGIYDDGIGFVEGDAGGNGGPGFGGGGGAGASGGGGGGGGGGGFFGGGGGGGGAVGGPGGGGGGGSSHVTATATTSAYAVDTGGVPQVKITYTLPNAAPDCGTAAASPATILPATRDQFKIITLPAASDADGDALTYRIDAVTQDERVAAPGTGDDTSPDAQYYPTSAGADSNRVQVRAEANPKANGRVYRITYTVSDSGGATCTRMVTVTVPRKKGQTAIDDAITGSSWDSFTGALIGGLPPY